MLREFLHDETTSGKLILAATLFALVVVNSPLISLYTEFWTTKFAIGLGGWSVDQDLRHWVSEGLMAFFFLVVGLEIKREIVRGELHDIKAASLPVAAAIGGMIVPALIYVSLNMNPDTIRGWGIPIATDIAFAVGILMLLGNRIPLSLKVFLLTLAIADDIGAIIIIALFYAEIIHVGFLLSSIGIVIATWLLQRKLHHNLTLFIAIGIVLWFTTHLSGIHASIVGAIIGLLAPITVSEKSQSTIAERLEKSALPVSTFIALPLFAFSSAGIVISELSLGSTEASTIFWGVLLGLGVGKVVGIVCASWLAVRLGYAKLPSGIGWQHITGVGFLAGIGFTVSLFITELGFAGNEEFVGAAKLGIFAASSASAAIGSLLLIRAAKKSRF